MRTEEPPVYFGDWLKRRRQSLDLTQAELAERAGCSVFALRKIESGERRPSKQLAALVAGVLEIDGSELDAFVRAARGDIGSDRLPPLAPPEPFPIPVPIAASAPLGNWPAQLTPLVGRENELASLGRLVADPLCRLLTLIGPGGIGKTRLAIEVAAQERAHFGDGAWFVPLAPVTTPAAILPAIAEALGFTLHGQTELRVQLLDHLAGKEALLVLDNLEHLLAGVGLLTEILTRAPRVKLLVTSRERLNLQSEYVFVTQGLPVPPSDQLHRADKYDAIRLFSQSARRAGADITLADEALVAAAHVCRLVDGMPLGIELAAAWTPLLSCGEIAAEIQRSLDFLTASLRDLPERQRSLRAVFDHSWRLLTPEERDALSRLATFQGGFERRAAEEVAGASLPTLLALTSKSLIHRSTSGRFDLHEVVRQYAYANLSQTPVCTATCDCHSRYFLALLDGHEPALRSKAQVPTLRSLLDEIDNLRTAWDWAVTHGLFDALARAVRCFGCLFELAGWLEEGVALLETAIQAAHHGPEDPVRRRVMGEARAQQALLLMRQGRFPQSLQRASESLDLLRPLGDPDLLVRPQLIRNIILHMVGDLDASEAAGEEALRCAQQVGDRWAIAYVDFLLGHVVYLRGHRDAGYERMHRGLGALRQESDPRTLALGLNFISPAAIALGYHDEAEASLQESLEICREQGDRWGMGTALRFLGLAALAQGDVVRAQDMLHRSLEVHQGFVVGWDIARTLTYLGNTELALGELDEARQYYEEAQQWAEDARSRPAALDALVGLAQVAALAGQTQQALALARMVLDDDASSQDARGVATRLCAVPAGQNR